MYYTALASAFCFSAVCYDVISFYYDEKQCPGAFNQGSSKGRALPKLQGLRTMYLNEEYDDGFKIILDKQATLLAAATEFSPLMNNDDLEDFYIKYLFSVVVKFNESYSSNRDACYASFKGFYLSTCRELIGNSWSKKVPLQPFVRYSLDVKGSRNYPANLSNPYGLHIHGEWLLHPETVEQWLDIDFERIARRDYRIEQIHISPYDPCLPKNSNKDEEVCGSSNLIDYNNKATRPKIDQDVNWNFFPENMGLRIRGLTTRAGIEY